MAANQYSGLIALGKLNGKTISTITITSGGIGIRIHLDDGDSVEINGYYEPLEVDYYEQDFNRQPPSDSTHRRRCIHPPTTGYEDKILHLLRANGALWEWQIIRLLNMLDRFLVSEAIDRLHRKNLIWKSFPDQTWRCR